MVLDEALKRRDRLNVGMATGIAVSISRLMWETVELREIRIFLTLADERHFGRTAERLKISQPRVSQALRSLEAQLGGQLFDRTSRRVTLTPLGHHLLSEVRDPAAALSRALASTYGRSRTVEGTIVVTWLSPAAQGPYLPHIVGHFHDEHPDCRITINDQLRGHAAVRAVIDHEADVLISWLPLTAPELARGPTISSQPRVLAVGRGHPLAARVTVTLEDIADYRVTPPIEGFPREFLEVLVPRETADGRAIRRLSDRPLASLSDALPLLLRGEIVHPTVPSVLTYFPYPDVVLIPIEGMPPLESALFWRSDTEDPRINAFTAATIDVVPPRLEHAQVSRGHAAVDSDGLAGDPLRVATAQERD